MEYVLVPRRTATKKANISKTGNWGKDERDDHLKGVTSSNDKKAAMLPSETKEKGLFYEIV